MKNEKDHSVILIAIPLIGDVSQRQKVSFDFIRQTADCAQDDAGHITLGYKWHKTCFRLRESQGDITTLTQPSFLSLKFS